MGEEYNGYNWQDGKEACEDALFVKDNAFDAFGDTANSWLDSFDSNTDAGADFGDVFDAGVEAWGADSTADTICDFGAPFG